MMRDPNRSPERVEHDYNEAVDGGRWPGGAPGGDVALRWAVVAAAVEVQLGAGEEEATGEEVDCQRVEREDRYEHQRPAKEPRTSAVARRRRHRLRFRSGGRQGATAWVMDGGQSGPPLVKPAAAAVERMGPFFPDTWVGPAYSRKPTLVPWRLGPV